MAPSPDIDRGWAFVVIAGYFFVRFLVLGMTFSPAILYSRLLHHFDESPVLTAWAINLNTFMTYMSGEITNLLIKTIGPRLTLGVGCIISSVGLLATSFAPNLLTVFLCFGVVTGVGYNMIYISSLPVVAQYLVRYRRLAVLLASSGLCIGQFVLPHVFRLLTEAYTWRGALMLLAGFNLNFLVVCAAYMPVRPAIREQEEIELQELHQHASEEELPSRLPPCITNLRLCRNPFLFLYFLSSLLAAVGVSAIATHIKDCARIHGISGSERTLLQSLLGASSLLGSVVIGICSMHPKVRIMSFNITFFCFLGLCIACFGFLSSFTAFVVMTCVLGFWMGILSAFPEAIISIVGVDNVATGLSYCSMGVAIGIVTGGPLAAFLLAFDSSYVLSFLVTGGLCMAGSFLNLPFLLKDMRCRRSNRYE